MRNSWSVHHHQTGVGSMQRIRVAALAALCWTASGCAARTALPGRPQPSTVVAQTQSIRAVPLDLNWVRRWYDRPIHRRASTALRGPKPLYVVDGRRMTAAEFEPMRLNPNGIVEVHILKEADARPLYGEAAAGGVVIITTRAGTRP